MASAVVETLVDIMGEHEGHYRHDGRGRGYYDGDGYWGDGYYGDDFYGDVWNYGYYNNPLLIEEEIVGGPFLP